MTHGGLVGWFEEGTDVAGSPSPGIAAHEPRRWPIYAVLGLAAAGLVAALWRSPVVSAAGYALLLLGGCGLLFYRRYDAIAATRSAGGSGVLTVQATEKLAIAALSLACLVNGLVVAYEVAAWTVWVDLREGLFA